MPPSILVRMFEHNNGANLALLDACGALTDEQLDTVNPSASDWSIRYALTHLVESQRSYLLLLTKPPESRTREPIPYPALRDSVIQSGEGLLELVSMEPIETYEPLLRSTDGYEIEPWVVLVQAINHGADHRRQVRRNMRYLGVTPPDLDGWSYADTVGGIRLRADGPEHQDG